MEQSQASFSGWALIEIMGHQHEAGYVTTEYYGDKAMFRVDVPEIPAREETLTRPQWTDTELLPIGAVIQKEAIAGRTCMLNPGAIYRMNPATEEAVRAAIAANQRRAIKVISLPSPSAERILLPGEQEDDIDDYQDEDNE